MVAQLQRLFLLVLSQRLAADDPTIDSALALWQGLHASEGTPSAAWQGVLTALLRDPEYLLY